MYTPVLLLGSSMDAPHQLFGGFVVIENGRSRVLEEFQETLPVGKCIVTYKERFLGKLKQSWKSHQLPEKTLLQMFDGSKNFSDLEQGLYTQEEIGKLILS